MNVLDKGSGPGAPPEPEAASGPGTPPEPDAPADAPDASRRERRRARTRRRLGRGGIAVVIVLALIGAWSSWGWLTATPEAGHFRSTEGRDAYLDAYEESFEALPEPSSTHDLRTSHGIARDRKSTRLNSS